MVNLYTRAKGDTNRQISITREKKSLIFQHFYKNQILSYNIYKVLVKINSKKISFYILILIV